ncbi:hypothetical protein, conserved [Entamoeba dispar SAW760]|uniref:Leucine rich repeat containing protein BspA family protein n=1 Tax=Entamoeba dispar (strain ATCC PRA-260 / SAW760) TaxID=370354 RepID=B0EU74_ENTDS|nr:uncharacterized protein EDI_128390 [Entamoeba dispar SAW760]EDR21926.1 hypothetical protein, conserved [Entamoeba dispar SAW760]|eukprot:EDR21926.1 hypothetical protein, conserved [Entamoeba dispar SAW760]
MKLGYNEIMITSMFFDDIKDFINLEIGVKRFQGNMERFHFNPIPLNEYSRKLFPNIETFHIYNYSDKIFNDGRIFKKVIWYLVDYSTYLKEKRNGSDCKNITYTKYDRNIYGNIIPPEVTSLGYECFARMYGLLTIIIPTMIKRIEDNCFEECKSLKSVIIQSTLYELGSECFYGCTGLTSMGIEKLQFISKERIFMNEPVLISIKIPDNLEIVNGKRIKKKDINEFIIPSSITKLGNRCFILCTTLTSINIPTPIKEIGDGCFLNCVSLISINLQTLITEIPDNCFNGCISLSQINIPTSINKIGFGCFEKCYSLTLIDIPSLVTSFNWGCFSDCGCENELKNNERIPKKCFDTW